MKKNRLMLTFLSAVIVLFFVFQPYAVNSATDISQPVSLSVSSENTLLNIQPDDPFLNSIYDRFNIQFEVVSTGAYDASEVYRLLAALNNLPDILIYDARWELNYFIQSEAISPLPTDMYVYPNLSSFITYPYASALQYNSMLWGIPTSPYASNTGLIETCAVFYKDIYDAVWHDSKPPEAIDQWHDLLDRIKTEYPDLIPLTSKKPQSMFDLAYFYSPVTYTWIWNKNRYIPGYYSDEYCDSIRALKTLWDDGLLDTDFMNEGSGRPTGLDKFFFGQAAGIMYTCSPYTWQSEFIPIWQTLHAEESFRDKLQIVFLPGNAQGDYYEAYNYNMTSIYFGANIQSEAMKRALTMLDWICSDEGHVMRYYGLENTDYVLSADHTIQPLTDCTQLYQKYPSYAFFRMLPNWDSITTWQNEARDSDISFLIDQYIEWRNRVDVKPLPYTSLRANTISTPAVLNFYPNILRSGYRMLTSTDIDVEFEQIKQEYRDDGIQLMIDSVYHAMNQ